MSNKSTAKSGYTWAYKQRDKWEDTTSEKVARLEEILSAHLSWFDQHSTVQNLISWKRPMSSVAMQSTAITANARETTEGLTTSALIEKTDKRSDIVTDAVAASTITTVKPSIHSQFETTDSVKGSNAPLRTAPYQPFLDTREALTRKVIQSEHESKAAAAESKEEDYDEQEDEIEIVVSKRFAQQLREPPETGTHPGARSIVEASEAPEPAIRSVHTTARSEAAVKGSSNATVQPVEPNSTPKCSNQLGNPEMSNDNEGINAVDRTEVDESLTDCIEVSESEPEIPYKRFKLSSSSHQKTVSAPAKKAAVETQQSEQTATSITTDKESNQSSSVIPLWARSPELKKLLTHQLSTLNPDEIFGRLPPFQEQEIFTNNGVIEIPEKAPEAF